MTPARGAVTLRRDGRARGPWGSGPRVYLGGPRGPSGLFVGLFRPVCYVSSSPLTSSASLLSPPGSRDDCCGCNMLRLGFSSVRRQVGSLLPRSARSQSTRRFLSRTVASTPDALKQTNTDDSNRKVCFWEW